MLNENTFEKNDIMAPQRYVEVECHFRLTDLAMWPFCLIWDYSVPWILHMLRKQEVSYFKQTLPGLARVTGNKFHTWQETSVGCENGHFPQYRSLCQMPRSHITGASVRSHGLDGKGDTNLGDLYAQRTYRSSGLKIDFLTFSQASLVIQMV